MSNKVVKLNGENFNEISNKEITFAVRLWAEWCTPCRMMAPIYNQVADQISSDSLVMGELDIDKYPNIAAQLGVRSIPTVVVFKNGIEINRSVGMLPAPELTKLIINS